VYFTALSANVDDLGTEVAEVTPGKLHRTGKKFVIGYIGRTTSGGHIEL
jgi:hypothetical protein